MLQVSDQISDFTSQTNSLLKNNCTQPRILFIIAHREFSISLEVYESNVSWPNELLILHTVTEHQATYISFHENDHATVIFRASPNHN
jgi:hypothetical protein